MSSLGLAIIGAGKPNIATQQHLPALQHVPEARLVALHDVDEAGVRDYARQHGVDAYTDLAAMLARDDVEVIIVASPDLYHAEHTVAAARAGKHVLCQKPLALTLADARAMRAAVLQARVTFSAAQSTRYEAASRQAKELVVSGEIGDPVYAAFTVKGRFFSYPPQSPYRKRETLGQFVHNGMHYVDLVSHLLDSEPTRVFGMSRPHYPTDDRMETDNYTVCLLNFESGAMGRVEQNLTLLDPPGFPQRQEIRIIGTRGSLLFGTGHNPTLEVFDQAGYQVLQPQTIPPQQEPFVLLTRDFLQAILDHRPPPVSMDHSFRVLEACLGTVQSCATGEPVTLGQLAEVTP